MKTIYISGKIAGLEMLDAKRNFDLEKYEFAKGLGIEIIYQDETTRP